MIPKFTTKRIIELSAGPYHTLALTNTGQIFAWGNGRQGKLGIKGAFSVDTPSKVISEAKFGKIVS